MSGQSWERRRAQRVNASLNLEVRVPGAEPRPATLQTINISSSGIYFRSDHFIPPMTRLAMEIEVAVPSEGTAETGTATVPCEGLIVRVTPEVETPGCTDYEVAVFFTSISPEGMANLERHIALLITEDD
ncbi:MAG: PilZ domain-containing protein [bacterium]|nr:PilZ domain-containing protein [bacterium]